jgi:hypothetical protein
MKRPKPKRKNAEQAKGEWLNRAGRILPHVVDSLQKLYEGVFPRKRITEAGIETVADMQKTPERGLTKERLVAGIIHRLKEKNPRKKVRCNPHIKKYLLATLKRAFGTRSTTTRFKRGKKAAGKPATGGVTAENGRYLGAPGLAMI